MFYGDGKTLYRQNVQSSDESHGRWLWMVWAERAIGTKAATIEIKDKPTIACKRTLAGLVTKPLVQLGADEAKSLLAKAKILTALHQRQATYLARDDDGIYYYIDELLAGNGYRLFIGQKGAMKEIPLTNIVHDSAGELFASKNGSIKIIGRHGAMYWVKGDKKVELTSVDVREDHYLIYRELGIYGQLGAVCEDM